MGLLVRPAGQTSWTDELDRSAGRTSWTDQLPVSQKLAILEGGQAEHFRHLSCLSFMMMKCTVAATL